MLNFRDDPTALRAFITEHQDRVYNLVLNRVHDAGVAEEITQDVFIAVFQKPQAFRGEAAITTWLFRIAINKCIDHLRKKQSHKRGGLMSLFRPGKQPMEQTDPVDFNHPGVVSERKEKAAILFKAMKQLPEKQHTAWVLSEMENRSYKDISEIMNLSMSSVESLLFRARQNLRKIISDMYPGEE